MLDQYDRLWNKKAFLDQYKKEDIFANGFEEFEDSRRVVQEMSDEYRACESEDYINYS